MRVVTDILKDCSTFEMLGTACIVMRHHVQEHLDFRVTLSRAGFRISILNHSTQQFVVNDVRQENMYFGFPMPFVSSLIISTHLTKKLYNPTQPQAIIAAVT